jgi:hypothetical protein
MLQTIKEEFLNELNNQSALSGSYYGVADVARIINLFTMRVAAIEQPVRATIDEDTITRITEIAEVFATNHARNCAENYCFDDVDYDTNDYRGELTVTATVNVDSDSLSRSATFNATAAKAAFRELLTPNAQPNA